MAKNENANAILFIHSLTSLHPGSGTALGTVDLPVQRERHTQWPLIPGSSLKGILRDACRPADGDDEARKKWEAVFGPEKIEAGSDQSFAGALSLTDARILAFPVRSLCGVFAWTTCPAVLARLRRDLDVAGLSNAFPEIAPFSKLAADRAAFGDALKAGSTEEMVLEEYAFTRDKAASTSLASIADWIALCAVGDKATSERIRTHLAVLPDDHFTHFVRHATEIVARVRLEHQTKTVRKGALFYEEFLPPETLFYAITIAEESRSPEVNKMTPEAVINYLRETMDWNRPVQIGANETIGKGICSIKLYDRKENTK